MRGKGQDVSTSLVTFPSPGAEPGKDESKLFVAGTDIPYFLLPRVTDILVRLEKRPDINCLPSPNISVHSPVQGELQGPPVEGSRYSKGYQEVGKIVQSLLTYVTALTDIIKKGSV